MEDKVSDAQQAIFNKGTNVGVLAQQLFPGGIDLSEYIPSNFAKVFSETSRLINEGHEVIYEAGFRWNSSICFVDILVKRNGKWYAYEVKGSTSISDINLWDTAFQYHVLTTSGIELEDFSVIYLNNRYIRREELNLNELFIVESVLKSIIPLQNQVTNKIIEMNQILNSGIVPDMEYWSSMQQSLFM